jgi:hypothetical protein
MYKPLFYQTKSILLTRYTRSKLAPIQPEPAMRLQRPRRRSSFSSARPKGAGRSFSPRLDVQRHSLTPKYSPQPITTTSPPPLPTLSPLIRPRNLSEKSPPSSSPSQIASTPPSLIESSTQKPKLSVSSTNTIKGDHISHPQPKVRHLRASFNALPLLYHSRNPFSRFRHPRSNVYLAQLAHIFSTVYFSKSFLNVAFSIL